MPKKTTKKRAAPKKVIVRKKPNAFVRFFRLHPVAFWVIVVVLAVGGYWYGSIAYDRYQFAQVEKVMDEIVAEIDKTSDVQDLRKEYSCGYASAKLDKGTRGCDIDITFRTLNSFDIASQGKYTVKESSVLEKGTEYRIILVNNYDGFTCSLFIDTQSNHKFYCTKEAKAEHFPVKND